MKPGWRNLLIIGAIVLVTFGIALLLGRRYQTVKLSRAPSTFNASPYGWKAGYVTLERLREPVERWQHPWTKLSSRRGILVVAGPSFDELYGSRRAAPPSAEECDALARWVARGNTLLLYASADESFHDVIQKFGLEAATSNRVQRTKSEGDMEDLFGSTRREPVTLPSIMPTTVTRGVERVELATTPGLQPERGVYVPLVAGSGQSIHALWLKHQRGQVVMFSSASFIDNQFLPRQDNLALFLNVLREFKGAGTIFFDEYHHGYSEEFAMRDFLQLPMVRLAGVQVAVLIGLLIVSQWRRFGEPVPLVQETRRSVMEYAVSLGDLYARAETQIETLDYLFTHLRRELTDRYGLPATATAAQIAGRLDTSAAIRQDWERLAADCGDHLRRRSLKRFQFAQLAQRIQKFRRQLR